MLVCGLCHHHDPDTVERLAALRLWLKYRTANEPREERTLAVAGVRRLCACERCLQNVPPPSLRVAACEAGVYRVVVQVARWGGMLIEMRAKTLHPS